MKNNGLNLDQITSEPQTERNSIQVDVTGS